MTAGIHTAPEAAEILDCTPWFVKKLARENGLGYIVKGYRFTDADIARMREILSPKPAPTRRRRNRRAVA